MKNVPDIAVLGTGFAGLTAAVRLIEEGHRVRCHGDRVSGASLQNFGQLHSGAVYAPVLPDVAAACWQYSSRWFGLLGSDIPRTSGLALFSSHGEDERYTQAWSNLGIPAKKLSGSELDEYRAQPSLDFATAFALPDVSVDVAALHSKTIGYAAVRGVDFAQPDSYTLAFSGAEALLWSAGTGYHQPHTLVLAAGYRTAHMLNLLGIEHPLAINNLPYGVLESPLLRLPLTYWLDGDMFAVSPRSDGVKVALPGRPSGPTDDATERYRLSAAFSRRWPEIPAERLQLRWGHAAEPVGNQPDPSAVVVDLSSPPPGWGRVANMVVCLPGKWTTAWHAADQVAQAVSVRG